MSNILKLIAFVVQSEVRFGDAVQIGEVRFLPIDCLGALRLFGKENLERISVTLADNYNALESSQKAFAKALQYVIDNKFDSDLCDNEHQISFIRDWVHRQSISNEAQQDKE